MSIIKKMPLPYKVAKSLDPFIYRNTSFDAWLATKKGNRHLLLLNFLHPNQTLFPSLIF